MEPRVHAPNKRGRGRRGRAVFYSPADIVGGAVRYLSLLLPKLACTREVWLFCPDSPELDTWVADLRAHGVLVFRFSRRHDVRRLFETARFIRACRKADLLHINLITTKTAPQIGVLGWLIGVPLRTGTQHLPLMPEEMSHYRIKQLYFRILAEIHRRTLHWVISPSYYSAAILVSGYGFKSDKVRVIHHAVDLDDAGINQEPRPRRAPDIGGASWPVLSCIGVVEERKGQHLIIEALPELCRAFPHVLVIFVGGGSDIGSLTETARRLGVEQHVEFAGHQDDVNQFYRRTDIFLLPSGAESFGLSVIEAMAHRLPVIANDIPPLREVLGDTGVLMKTRSAEAIVEAVSHILAMQNPQDFGAAGRARAEAEFHLADMVGRTLQLFDAGLEQVECTPTFPDTSALKTIAHS